MDAERVAGVVAGVGDAGDEPEGGRGPRAAYAAAEFGGREHVLGFGDGFDLRDDNGGAGVEGEADGGVVVAGDAGWDVSMRLEGGFSVGW